MSEHTPRDIDDLLDARLEAIAGNDTRVFPAPMWRHLCIAAESERDQLRALLAEIKNDSIYRSLKAAEAKGMRIIIEPMVPRESDKEA